jgi:hypothetical protein
VAEDQRMDVISLQTSPTVQLIAELDHKNLLPFVAEYYRQRRSWVVWLHYGLSLGLLALLVAVGVGQKLTLDGWLTQFGLAMLTFFALVPIHEAIHGLAYRFFGATDVRFSYSLRQFYAYAIAHNFVVGRREFIWVALMPFLAITAGFGALVFLLPAYRFYALAVLLVHTSGTSGDWALLNYVWLHRGTQLYTYDDAERHKTYFYAAKPESTPPR